MPDKPQKLDFETFQTHMSVFLDFPDLEDGFDNEIINFIERHRFRSLNSQSEFSVDNLVDHLRNDDRDSGRLKAIIGLTGGSLERLKRILLALYPEGRWNDLRNDESVLKRIANFMVNPDDEESIPRFIRNSFQLPKNWVQLLGNKQYLRVLAQKSLQSKYAVRMGQSLENSITDEVSSLHLAHEKGQVEIVDFKEVDVAIPNVSNPEILIMSSYALTTSSSQSSRANEQAAMYEKVQTYNRRSQKIKYGNPITFINVIDGGGWIERKNDLLKMWVDCDYCFCNFDIKEIGVVLKYHFSL